MCIDSVGTNGRLVDGNIYTANEETSSHCGVPAYVINEFTKGTVCSCGFKHDKPIFSQRRFLLALDIDAAEYKVRK